MANTRIRAALYARVSTTGHGQDVGLQLDELRQVAAQRGWHTAEYVDDGVSGTKTSRPALDRMLADAQAGRLDLVVVWKLDRLGRSLQHVLGVLDQLTGHGVGFVSLRDAGLDTTTPAGRLFTAIIAAFAEFERGVIQERVVAGVRRAQAAGKHCGRPRKDTADKALVAAKALLDQGWGWRAVAEATGIQKDTLRRRLRDAGMLAQNPTPGEAA
jgi:DNA invertase Pin-like site-specific DNA recombinase